MNATIPKKLAVINNNKLRLHFIFLVLSATISATSYGQKTASLLDPEEFGKEFISVCRVGLKGGDGTLVEKNWVLTAGHVAEGMYNRTNGNLSVYFDNGTNYKVKNVFLHPKYEAMGLYDIALLELQDDVKNIPPIKINTDLNELNQLIILAGHGDKKSTDGSWITDGKLRAYTNIVDKVDETHIVFDYDSPEDSPTEREGTSGPGDSGGPAFIKIDNTLYVAGVSSTGEPGKDGPTTFGAIEHFVRVSKFQSWIQETIRKPNPDYAFTINKNIPITDFGNIELSKSNQSKRAMLIVETLESYSEERMINAISETFDSSILQNRTAVQIIKNMPALIRELQNAKIERVLAESPSKISVQMKKENALYGLDIFFDVSSQKIVQLAFGGLN